MSLLISTNAVIIP